MSFVLLIVTILSFIGSSETFHSTPLPKFSDYPVADSEYYHGKHKKLINDRYVRMWTYINASDTPNFAGHYIIAGSAIGTGEIDFAIINSRTGKVCHDGFSIAGYTLAGESPLGLVNPLRYRLSSKLLIVHGERNEDGKYGTFYYKFENNNLVLIRTAKY